jgi:hypothetical protein
MEKYSSFSVLKSHTHIRKSSGTPDRRSPEHEAKNASPYTITFGLIVQFDVKICIGGRAGSISLSPIVLQPCNPISGEPQGTEHAVS